MKYSHKSKPRQYTIRDIPSRLDEALRRKAKESGMSLNQTVLETLSHGAGITSESAVHTDLDDVIGTWVEDPKFDEAIADQRHVDPEMWK